jgi:putative ABC transport system permease protein
VEAVSQIVPAKWRASWRQEWEAEIRHRAKKLQEWNRATWRNQMKLLKRTLGAISDAAWLRQQFTWDLDVMQDIRYGLRMLRKNPGFTLVAVLTLALGIGANTAIFSMVHGVLLTPLPFNEPDRLVMVWEKNYVRGREHNVVNPGNFMRWRERNQVFESMSALGKFNVTLTGEGDPERIPLGYVSGNLFSTLGARAIIGRGLLAEDGEEGAEDVVVLSHALWQRRFGADKAILGKTLSLNGTTQTVVGVMPPEFSFPSGAALWAPMKFTQRHYDSRGRSLLAMARLKDGVTLEQAQAGMENLGRQLEEERPEFNAGWNVNVFPLHQDLVREFSLALWVLMGAVGFVLLIGCANLANLLLARANNREKELSIRSALGAGRLRILRQLMTESILLALVGGLAGILTAKIALDALLTLLPTDVPSFLEISLNPQVLGFAVGISLLTGLLFGTAPAWQSIRVNVQDALKEGGRNPSGGGNQIFRNLLVIGEVALSLILLVGAGLLVRSFLQLSTLDPGFDTTNLLNLQVSLTGSKYPNSESRNLFLQQALEKIEAVPGVQSAGGISWQPLGGIFAGTSFVPKDRPEIPAAEQPVATVVVVAGDLFRTMRIPLLQGRVFDSHDSSEGRKVVVINKAMAREYWPDGDAVGKPISMSWGEWIDAEVIGVVDDVHLVNLDTAPRATIYWHQPQLPYSFMTLVVRGENDPAGLVPAVRTQMAGIDPDLPLSNIRTMNAVIAESLKQPRFTVLLLGLFSTLALALALIGVYGVISYAVGQRTHEIGIRMAMGARQGDILRMVLGKGINLVLIGASLGLVGAFTLSRYLESLLFETPATDPLTFIGVSLVLMAVALLACYVPARRATKVDPMVALRYE